MDTPRYSLNDIFGLLREATLILDKRVTVIAETETGAETETPMMLSEFIAMSVARELTDISSRMASETTTATKEDVIEAMKANYYEPVAYPVYEGFGVRMSGGSRTPKCRSSRSTRRSSKAK
jgi:hypothetical protein